MNRLFLIFVSLSLIPINIPAQQKIEFIAESIDFTINRDLFSINGIYYFTNKTEQEVRQTIFFPFSKNADSIIIKRVYNLTYSESLNYQKFKNAIAFSSALQPA